MKITKHEIIEAIKAEKVFNPHEIAEIAEKVHDIEVMDYSYGEVSRFVRNWGYEDDAPVKKPNDYQRFYTVATYGLKVLTIKAILFDFITKKDREIYEQSKQTNKQA